MNSRALARAASIADLRKLARRRLPRSVFDFIDGAAGDEITSARNIHDLQRLVLVPRYMKDVSERNLSTTILGGPAALPLVVAPTGLAALAWPRADIAIACAAAQIGVPFIVSTSSSMRLEQITAAVPAARVWFQVYLYKDQKLVEALIERSKRAGIEALVVTIDTPVLGFRERDHRNRFTVPLRPTPRLVWDLIRCWRWSLATLRHGVPRMQNFTDYGHGKSVTSLATLMTSNMDPSVTWPRLNWLRERWPGKILVKGILAPEDAELAVQQGVDGLIVSNHGGRQLDGGPSTVSMLPEVVRAVGGRCEVFIDGGIRRGSDIAKVVAMGARAAMVGRPMLYGAAAGSTGAMQALTMLKAEYDRCLALLGRPSTATLNSDAIRVPAFFTSE